MHYLTTLLSRSRKTRALRSIAGVPHTRRRRRLFLEHLEDRRLLATFSVLNMDDSGGGSLRQAVLDANASPGDDIIQFSLGVTGTITLTSGELKITDTVDLQGPGAGVVAVSGNNASRVFYVGADATISGLTITGGSAGSDGGGIYNQGRLTLDQSTLTGNRAYNGGGIFNAHGATLTVDGSTLSGNLAALPSGGGSGGGIINWGTLTVDNSTFSGNSAGNGGGGIHNAFHGTLTVQNSTFSGNSAAFGGGIYNDKTLTLKSSTLSGNSAWENRGGGIYIGPNAIATTLNNTIVAANFSDDISGAVGVSSSHNLVGVNTNLSGISHGSNGNHIGTAAAPINPMLGALQNNGGLTQTLALLPGSPAINAGDNSLIPAGVTTDQRGPGYARVDDGTVDIGAYELVVDNDPSTYIVNTLADTVDDDPAVTSLREAIAAANANNGADIIQFAPNVIGTITLTSGELAITDSVDIQGPGSGVVAVSANNASRVFNVTANATISGLTISGGNSTNGGGIYNAYGTLTVRDSTFTGNSAANGGGIYNAYGALTVDHSTFSGNSSSGVWYYGPGYSGGGGIYNANYGTRTVVHNSTFTGNSTAFAGGGIYNQGTMTVDHSTLSGGSAASEGGGLFNWGTLTVVGSTLSDNSAGGAPGSNGAGGGILNFNTLSVKNSTLSGNYSSYQGGGIYNRGGVAAVDATTFTGNSAHYYGGGILNHAALTVDGSTFSGNSAHVTGGGISNGNGLGGGTAAVHNSAFTGNSADNGGGVFNSGAMTVDRSTLSGNSAAYGGGLDNIGSGGALTVRNSTLSGNSSAFGGGISNRDSAALTLESSTLSGNSAWENRGGGIYINSTGASTLNNTIVAANSSDDVSGTVGASSSHNLIGVNTNLSGISHGSHGNQIGTAAAPINPMLGALQDNGGLTQTLALLPGSPAINAGDNSLIPAGVTTDQRGPGYARVDDGTVDIGAFELVLNGPPTADAGADQIRSQGEVVSFDGTNSSDADGTIIEYSWTFGDGTSYTETAANAPDGLFDGRATHLYSDNGAYSVELTVTDNNAATAVDTASVTVQNIAPTVDSGSDLSLLLGGSVTLNGAFSDPGRALGESYTATIDWGDGQTTSGTIDVEAGTVTGAHDYAAAGNYTVTLTVSDNGDPAPDQPATPLSGSDTTLVVVVRPVTVNIQPESLNVDSNGTITVAIFGAVGFDTSQIDVGSVLFAGAGAWQATLVDVNGDGQLDLQLKFRTQDTILDQIYAELLEDDLDADGILDSTRQVAEVAVTGLSQGGTHFSGSDDLELFLSGRALRELLDELFAS
ncbi:MAG TPA: choice-of-anchor Q domain-containing protein [Pirellulaceae bacterium]|nr:choice-of-anchor Q domain-containing protein [Pirellulaceae bacterium]